MRTKWFCMLALGLALLAGCTQAALPAELPEETPAGAVTLCRIAFGADTGNLMLAAGDEQGTSLYYQGTEDVPITVDGEEATAADLKNGMLVEVCFSGMVQESWPAGFTGVTALNACTEGADDRCGLYLEVLEDLWAADPGLNADVTELGLDLSGVTDLSRAEQSALSWRFGERHGMTVWNHTFEELVEEGMIDGERLCWEDGVLFTVTGGLEEGFQAGKWRGGTGAYYFTDCTARQDGDGAWSYTVGAEAIS